MITYTGIRTKHARSVVVCTPDGPENLRHHNRHSPDGFEWGYGGSGPSDLALSILIDYFNRQGSETVITDANFHYQAFKWAFISGIKEDGWSITEDQIKEWLEGVRGDAPDPRT